MTSQALARWHAPYDEYIPLVRALEIMHTAAAAAHLTRSVELRGDPLADDPKDPDHTNLIRHLAFARSIKQTWLNGEFIVKQVAA